MPAPSDEFALIEWIRSRVSKHPRLTIGIGDDAAALQLPENEDCLVAVDMLMEGVHFTFPEASPRDVGRKALAVNLSDIAAMAGQPVAAVVSLAYPRGQSPDFARDLHMGLQTLADEFGVAIAGGDSNTWDGPLVISVTVLGTTTGTGAMKRSGAQVGDWILTTGSFGGSIQGKHLTFRPRVEEALRLHQETSLHAMIDVSDGLAADLHHLLDESGVGAVVYADAIPISDAARASDDGRTPLEHSLSDGEDFELLFTVSARDGEALMTAGIGDVELSHIGEITAPGQCEIVASSGERHALPASGWKHQFE